ncbi:hypothetical protein [Nitrobacter sp. Nb-311A]|uniref:hypothetical protein n=1 Tax=Nitrobacter sp. Nb-311A TaxID=314253 RepID=UPI000592B35A|nr:hypothetical protein [Nitrobacter sp. Nb-311A]
MKGSDLLAIDFRHVWVQQGRRLLGAGQQFGQFGLTRFERANLVLQPGSGYAIKNGLDGFI